MMHDGGSRVAQVLAGQGVKFVFTLIGGHVSPILVSAKRLGMRVIDVRSEATAVFAADAVARLSGVPGVAVVTAGPGLTNTVTAVKNAQLAQSPLVILGGATATILKGRGALQDIDQMALMKPHVKRAYAVRRVRDLAPAVEAAFTESRRGIPGPVFVECPVDLLYPEKVVREWYAKDVDKLKTGRWSQRAMAWYIERHLNRAFGELDATPHIDEPLMPPEPLEVSKSSLAQALSMLHHAERPVLVIGSQAMNRPERVEAIAAAVETLGVPLYLAGMARGLMGRDHPLHLRRGRSGALREADLVLLAGVPCDFRLNYGRQIGSKTRVISANLSIKELTKNRRPDLALLSHPGRFLEQLARISVWPEQRWQTWLETLRGRDRGRAASCLESCDLVDPIHLSSAIDEAMDTRDSVVVVDGGDFVATASYIVRPPGPLSWLDPGVFGTLGVGAGFALGARLCRPEAEVWLLYGDGSLGYSMIELDTFARHGLGLIAVVGNDASWAQIARDQVALLEDDVATVLARTAYHDAARGLGAEGLEIVRDIDVTPKLQRAKMLAAQGKPVLVNAMITTTDARAGSISI